MGVLVEAFSNMLDAIGMRGLKHPIFYNAPIGIRFEIGGEEAAYLEHSGENEWIVNSAYISGALKRAKALYENLPQSPNVLRIDGYTEDKKEVHAVISDICMVAKIPIPQEQIVKLYRIDDDVTTFQVQCYWDLSDMVWSYEFLLEKIIEADFGGYCEFTSNVYFADTKNMVLFHLYDDRGADIVATNKEMLRWLFDEFNHWILEYDRTKINSIFVK